MKEPKCKICGSDAHYAAFCFQAPRKPLAKTPIKPKAYTFTIKAPKPLKRSRIASQGKSQRSILTKEADRVFSIYIRRKDALNNYARCVTCGDVKHYKSMQNGHYIKRGRLRVRWDEMNCHVQCKNCNENLNGNMLQYNRYMVYKYGYANVEDLKIKAVAGDKVTLVDIQNIIDTYTRKVAEL